MDGTASPAGRQRLAEIPAVDRCTSRPRIAVAASSVQRPGLGSGAMKRTEFMGAWGPTSRFGGAPPPSFVSEGLLQTVIPGLDPGISRRPRTMSMQTTIATPGLTRGPLRHRPRLRHGPRVRPGVALCVNVRCPDRGVPFLPDARVKPGHDESGKTAPNSRVHGVRRYVLGGHPPLFRVRGAPANRHPRARPGDLAPAAHGVDANHHRHPGPDPGPIAPPPASSTWAPGQARGGAVCDRALPGSGCALPSRCPGQARA